MNKLTTTILIVPVLAIFLSLSFYNFFLRRVTDSKDFRKLILTIFVVGFIINFAWELLQVPLYQSMPADHNHVVLCALASVADAVMVVLLYFIISIVSQLPFWILDISISMFFLCMSIGFLGAVVSEMWHLKQGNWNYSKYMPIIPILKVGLSPALQFTILPLLIYYLSRKLTFGSKIQETKSNKN